MAIDPEGRLAAHRKALAEWRAAPHDEQLARMASLSADRQAEPPAGRVRVGFWAPCAVHGGAESWQLTLARSLDPGKVVLSGLCLVDGVGAARPDVLDTFRGLLPVSAGREEARALAERSDVLVTWANGDPGRILEGLEHRPKVVFAVHLPRAGYGPAPVEYPAIDRYVAVSELALDAVSPGAESSVIWNAVDPARLEVKRDRAGMLARWKLPPDAKVAGFLQRLTWEKDPQAAIRLAASLPEPWHVVVVGDGASRGDLRRKQEELGLSRLRLAGPDPAAGDVLNAFDTLVVPSHYESFGLTLAEGLWLGKPTVSTPVGIAKIRPGLTREVPIGADGQSLAGAVLAAFESGPMPGSMEWAREKLDPARFGKEWTDLLVDLGTKARLERVAACPHRGSELPVSAYQLDGCCTGPTRFTCSAGKGKAPGQVTTRDCLSCLDGSSPCT